MDETRPVVSQESSLLHSKRLKQLYAALLRCRISGRLSSAREAILAAASLELGPDDHLLPQQAGALVATLKDSLRASADEIKNESLNDVTALTLATGMALGLKKAQRPGIVLAVARENAEADPQYTPVLVFASRNKLPIICILESTGSQRTPHKIRKPPLPIIIVEGSDSVAILRVIQECARRARQGHGPALIQCTRPSADPLEFLEEYLRKRNLWSDVWLERLEVEIRQASDKLKKTQV
jgi:hypothetical protein